MSTTNPPTLDRNAVFDSLWPLSRFVGYRPPPPPDQGEGTGYWADHFLPRPLREKRRQRKLEGKRLQSTRTGDEAGFEEEGEKEQRDPSMRKKVADKVLDMSLTILGAFSVTAFLCLLSRAPFLRAVSAPLILGSFGSEVLLYTAHDAPLSQPKNVFFGNMISAVLGVAVAKGFEKIDGFEVGGVFGVNWAAASVSLSLSIFVMQLFEITHPPGGAAALLAVTLPQVSEMGWWYVVQVLVSTLILLVWVLVINNLGGRRYPIEWWWKNKWIVI